MSVRWGYLVILLIPQLPFECAFGVFAADKKISETLTKTNPDKNKPKDLHRPAQGAGTRPG